MTYEHELNDAKKYLHNYCGLANCFVGGGNEWTPRQISWFHEQNGHKYGLYVNEDILGDGLTEVYLDYHPEDTGFDKYDAWLNTEEGHYFMEEELTYWLEWCLDGNNTDSHFVEEFDK